MSRNAFIFTHADDKLWYFLVDDLEKLKEFSKKVSTGVCT